MEVNIEYFRQRINEALEDILKNDFDENKEKSQEYLDNIIMGVCHILQLISHAQTAELREPVVRELEKLNKKF